MSEHIYTPKSYYTSEAWRCVHHKDRSEILVFLKSRLEWEVIATIWPTHEISAETAANFITYVINSKQATAELLQEARIALQAVIDEGLNFTTEQDVEIVVGEIKRAVG